MRNRSQNNRFAARLGDVLLSLLAIAGGVSIVLVILAVTMNISLMMFRTGSMEPTISTGSVAVVREIDATEMAEGDIITVDRGDDLLPVTHRVTEIQDVDEASGQVTFVMRGDANDADDPEPYSASTVQRTIFSIPGVAPAIQSLQNPLVLGGLTLGATTLVIWAFWPRRETAIPQPRGAHAAHGIALPVLVAAISPLLLQQHVLPDESNLTTEQVTGEYIRLQSADDQTRMSNMVPGQPVTWAVDVWADAPEPGPITLDLTARGQLDAIATEVVLCTPHPTALLQCDPESEQHVVDTNTLIHSDSDVRAGSMSSDETRRVLVTATLTDPPTGNSQGVSAEFHFAATGHNEQLSVGAGPSPSDETAGPHTPTFDLAVTGMDTIWLVAIALLLTIVGITVLIRRHADHSDHAQGGAYYA